MKLLLLVVLAIAWLSVEASYFPHGPNPVHTTSSSATKATKKSQLPDPSKAAHEVKEFKSTWIVEFNDLISVSVEEFGQYYDVNVMRIGKSNKYMVRGKMVSANRDHDKEILIKSDPRVRSIEFDAPRRRYTRQVPTTDPNLCDQWHLLNCPGDETVTINVEPVWQQNMIGNGVQICIVDDGVQHTHPDLSAGYVPSDSYDVINSDSDPTPSTNPADEAYHGTACAGLVAAQTNSYCGVGGAYGAKFSAIRLLSMEGNTDSQEATALSFSKTNNHIYSNSWGPSDDGATIQSPAALTQIALSGMDGRDGLGSIFVWAAGNGRQNNDISTKDGYASSPYVIAVSAVGETGRYASYSEVGASILVAAPGGDLGRLIFTTDIQGTSGYSSSDCTSEFAGTSAAAPVAAGAVALILEANPNLGWRDVKRIVALTAAKNDPTQVNYPWYRTGAGHWVSLNYGFGLVDAAKAVEAAKMWSNMGEMIGGDEVTNSETWGIPDTQTLTCRDIVYESDLIIETIRLYMDISHTYRGDLIIYLTSPMGTTVYLLPFNNDDSQDKIDHTFFTPFFMDEMSAGTWTLCILDGAAQDSGFVNSYTLQALGRVGTVTAPAASVTSTSPAVPILGDIVNVTITFTDPVGIFDASITKNSVRVGELTPTAVTIVSSDSTSTVAMFTVRTENLPVGEYAVMTGDLTVQNRMLYPMGNSTIGVISILAEVPVTPIAPVAAPITTPVAAPVAAQQPTVVSSAATHFVGLFVYILITMLGA